MKKCPICSRELIAGDSIDEHHLVPKTFKNRYKDNINNKDNKIIIHKVCHRKIHATFAESDLFSYYNTIERILEHDEIQKFVKWIAKKPADYYSKNIETRTRKSKRKR